MNSVDTISSEFRITQIEVKIHFYRLCNDLIKTRASEIYVGLSKKRPQNFMSSKLKELLNLFPKKVSSEVKLIFVAFQGFFWII